MTEDPLASIHRQWRERCIQEGTYKGIDPADVARGEARWRAECNRPPRRVKRKRKHPPKGEPD